MPESIRTATDELDAVGNTMKAITKGYAIASAGLAALVLFGSFVSEVRAHFASIGGLETQSSDYSLEQPQVIMGLFIGGLFIATFRDPLLALKILEAVTHLFLELTHISQPVLKLALLAREGAGMTSWN